MALKPSEMFSGVVGKESLSDIPSQTKFKVIISGTVFQTIKSPKLSLAHSVMVLLCNKILAIADNIKSKLDCVYIEAEWNKGNNTW